MKTFQVTVCYPAVKEVSYTIEGNTDGEVLKKVFAQWNYGSGLECETFLNTFVRSLSVNDVVIVDGVYYQCGLFGWDIITKKDYEDLCEEVRKSQYNNPPTMPGAYVALQLATKSRQDKTINN